MDDIERGLKFIRTNNGDNSNTEPNLIYKMHPTWM